MRADFRSEKYGNFAIHSFPFVADDTSDMLGPDWEGGKKRTNFCGGTRVEGLEYPESGYALQGTGKLESVEEVPELRARFSTWR
jgi:hypothetical protein